MGPLSSLERSLQRFQGDPQVCRELWVALEPIAQYDSLHSSDLGKTLLAFLKHGCNIAATADSLFLHRNSVLYRLRRIEEIAGFDPKSPEAMETLRVALSFADGQLIDRLTRNTRRMDENQH